MWTMKIKQFYRAEHKWKLWTVLCKSNRCNAPSVLRYRMNYRVSCASHRFDNGMLAMCEWRALCVYLWTWKMLCCLFLHTRIVDGFKFMERREKNGWVFHRSNRVVGSHALYTTIMLLDCANRAYTNSYVSRLHLRDVNRTINGCVVAAGIGLSNTGPEGTFKLTIVRWGLFWKTLNKVFHTTHFL